MARNLATKYTFTGPRTIKVLDRDPFEVQNIRLLVNETQKVVICSSMQKNLVTSVVGTEITYVDTLPPLVEGDKLTIEIDYGIEGAEAIEVELRSGKKKVTDSIISNGGTSNPDKTLGEIAEDVNTIPSTALEKELQEGKTKIAREILKKGGASDDKHSLSELAYDVTTIPNPESIEVPSVGSEWENVCKAMWTSNIPYTYDIIAEYNRVKDIYINMDEPEAYHCAIMCGYYDNGVDYVVLGNADAYVIGIGQEGTQAITKVILDNELTNKNYFWEDKEMNNHFIVYLYKDSFAGVADFTNAKTKNAPYCMYAKGGKFIRKFYASDRAYSGIYLNCSSLLESVDIQKFFDNNSLIVNNTIKSQTNSSVDNPFINLYLDNIEQNVAKPYIRGGKFKTLYFPNLKINDGILIQNNNQIDSSLSFPQLIESRNWLYEVVNPARTKMQKLECPLLKKVSGAFVGKLNDNGKFEGLTSFKAPLLEEIEGSLFLRVDSLLSLYLPKLHYIKGALVVNSPNLELVKVPQLSHIVIDGSAGLIANSIGIKELDLSHVVELESTSGWLISLTPNCTNLQSIKFGTLVKMMSPASRDRGYVQTLLNLKNITIGQNTAINIYLWDWIPTNVLADPTKTQELHTNIKNNLIANLATLTPETTKTLYLSQEIRNILDKEDEKNISEVKHWTLNPATKTI